MTYILYYVSVSSSLGKVAKVIKMRNSFTGLLITKDYFAQDKYLGAYISLLQTVGKQNTVTRVIIQQ